MRSDNTLAYLQQAHIASEDETKWNGQFSSAERRSNIADESKNIFYQVEHRKRDGNKILQIFNSCYKILMQLFRITIWRDVTSLDPKGERGLGFKTNMAVLFRSSF